MPAIYLVVVSALVATIAYRTYGAFLAARVAVLDDLRRTPAQTMSDGRDYVPTKKWVLFGHHFAAISGAGPLLGPVLAAQFGYAPGFVWLLLGSVLAGGVHDLIILTASVRSRGRSLANIAREQVSPLTATATSIAILFVMIVALAAMAIVVVNSLKDSAWGVFSIGMTVPIALLMGLWTYRIRPGDVKSATIVGVAALLLSEKATFKQIELMCVSADPALRRAGALAAGFRLTAPYTTGPLAPHLPLERMSADVEYTDGRIDLNKKGRLGTFRLALHWKADKQTAEQNLLFNLLRKMLNDDEKTVRVQAAEFLQELADERTQGAVTEALTK